MRDNASAIALFLPSMYRMSLVICGIKSIRGIDGLQMLERRKLLACGGEVRKLASSEYAAKASYCRADG